jgi:small subunit ribosomal protein S1
MEVVVLELDKEARRLSLGHKQLEENPWEVFETVFTLGSVHEGTVVNKNDKGFVVALPYGIEGFCPNRHANKEDGNKLKIEDKLQFEVLEFNKDSKKIIVSHGKLHEDALKAEEAEDRKRKVARGKATRQAVQNLNSGGEKSTLGDIDALSQLKAKMEEEEKGK